MYGRSEIKDFSQKITDHEKLNNYFNISPAISPDGNKIALITDRSGYSDVIIISSDDGKEIKKIVKGNRTPDFEEKIITMEYLGHQMEKNCISIKSRWFRCFIFN